MMGQQLIDPFPVIPERRAVAGERMATEGVTHLLSLVVDLLP